MKSLVWFASLFVAVTMATSLEAQTTDVGQAISTALVAYGKVPVTTTISVPRVQQVCQPGMPPHFNSGPGKNSFLATPSSPDVCHNETVYDQKTQTTQQVLAAANIKIIQVGDLSYGPKTRTEIPSQLYVVDRSYVNCTANQGSHQVNLTLTFQRQESVTLSHSITNTSSDSLKFDYKVTPVFDVSGELTFGQSATSGSASTDANSTTTAVSATDSVPVSGTSSVMAQLRVWPVRYTVPFQTTVVVDGDLVKNDKAAHLSDVLSEAQRTFPISGTLQADDASDGQVVFYNIPFDTTLCTSDAGIVENANVKHDKKTKLVTVPR